MAKTLAELQAELDAANAALAAVKTRTERTEPRKENYSFLDGSKVNVTDDGITLAVKLADLKFLPSKAGKTLVHTMQIQLPNGIRGQIVFTRK